MVLNDVGQVAEKCWLDIPVHFPHAELDEFVVMPNHVHGIMIIRNDCGDDFCGGRKKRRGEKCNIGMLFSG